MDAPDDDAEEAAVGNGTVGTGGDLDAPSNSAEEGAGSYGDGTLELTMTLDSDTQGGVSWEGPHTKEFLKNRAGARKPKKSTGTRPFFGMRSGDPVRYELSEVFNRFGFPCAAEFERLFPTEINGPQICEHVEFNTVQDGDCLVHAIKLGLLRMGHASPSRQDIRALVADYMRNTSERRVALNGNTTYKQMVVNTIMMEYWALCEGGKKDVMKAVRSAGHSFSSDEVDDIIMRVHPAFDVGYQAPEYYTREMLERDTEYIFLWGVALVSDSKCYFSAVHFAALSAVLSVNLVVYHKNTQRTDGEHWGRSSMSVLRSVDLPTVVVLYDGVHHYTSIEWAYGDPLRFFL